VEEVVFRLTARDLSYFEPDVAGLGDGTWVRAKGRVMARIGESSHDLRVSLELQLSSDDTTVGLMWWGVAVACVAFGVTLFVGAQAHRSGLLAKVCAWLPPSFPACPISAERLLRANPANFEDLKPGRAVRIAVTRGELPPRDTTPEALEPTVSPRSLAKDVSAGTAPDSPQLHALPSTRAQVYRTPEGVPKVIL
jgi:hypothetical protein